MCYVEDFTFKKDNLYFYWEINIVLKPTLFHQKEKNSDNKIVLKDDDNSIVLVENGVDSNVAKNSKAVNITKVHRNEVEDVDEVKVHNPPQKEKDLIEVDFIEELCHFKVKVNNVKEDIVKDNVLDIFEKKDSNVVPPIVEANF